MKNSAGHYDIIVQATKQEQFSEYYNFLKVNNILPSYLVTELSVIQSFLSNKRWHGHLCILDIGHLSTKAYMVYNDQVLSNHSSSIAGSTIDGAIQKNYRITKKEAQIYKHENSFFLTEDQMLHATSNQQEFATLMKQSITPLINQIKRWLLGYRIKVGVSIDQIYIIGGSANITNINLFLFEQLNTPVQNLNLPHLLKQITQNKFYNNQFSLLYLMGESHDYDLSPQNLLTKDFASAFTPRVNMEDTFFLFCRIFTISIIISLSFFFEKKFFLDNELKNKNKAITKLLKNNSELNLSKKQKKYLKKKPNKIKKILEKKEISIINNLKALEETKFKDATSPLAILSKHLPKNKKNSLIKYYFNQKKGYAEFISETREDLNNLYKTLKNLDFDESDIKINNKSKKLTLNLTGFQL